MHDHMIAERQEAETGMDDSVSTISRHFIFSSFSNASNTSTNIGPN